MNLQSEFEEDYRAFLEDLIINASTRHNKKVVVLIDEYDKPILDRIEEQEEAKK